jgi:hypothetical protein
MAKPLFTEVWARIRSCAGEGFRTRTGLPFTYVVDGDAIIPSRTDYRLSRLNFEKAFELVPISGPGDISNLVRGSAYVWAILHDTRISQSRW